MFFLLALLLLSSAFQGCSASFLSDALPQPGTSTRDQIKCYALPYGAIGFTTHILTYYTFIMLTFGRSPWRWKRISHYKLDLSLALIGLPLTLIPAIITMVRCRSRWVLYLLAGWKLSLSLMLAFTTMTTAFKVRSGMTPFEYARSTYQSFTHNQEKTAPEFKISVGRTILWLTLYIVGTISGFVGLVVLVKESWDIPLLRHLSYGAVGLFGFLGVLAFFLGCCLSDDSRFSGGIMTALGAAFVIFCLGAVIYSDWALAAIAGNMIGMPDGNNVIVNILFWSYFIAKRLPMLST